MNVKDAAETFRARFPEGGLERCDFRPHFDGYVVNAWCAMLPLHGEAQTREAALALLTEIAAWLRANAATFGVGDRLQLIVGFPESVKHAGRQIFKCWLPAAGLPALCGVDFVAVCGAFREMEFWSAGVEWPVN